jgi:hypothetical protein
VLPAEGAPRLLEENPYRSGWRPPLGGRLDSNDHGIAVEVPAKERGSGYGSKTYVAARLRQVRSYPDGGHRSALSKFCGPGAFAMSEVNAG